MPFDMTETAHDPKWKEWAQLYVQTVGAADTCKKAESEIKKLVPKTASEAFGHVSGSRFPRITPRRLR